MNRIASIVTVVAAVSLILTGCSVTAPATETSAESGPTIVASTSVYGSIAASIVGDRGTVTSIISKATSDPHSFEASARDQLTIADADLVIANGGGYDPFMAALVTASGTKAVVINAVDASSLPGVDKAGFNEHVWYSLSGMTRVIEAITAQVGSIDPAHESTYHANAVTLVSEIELLERKADELASNSRGDRVAVTEPVPLYLLEAAGLKNVTPDDFTEAIEEGSGVPPLALEKTLDLFGSDPVVLLGYNEQTASPETERVRQAAEKANVPVVSFTETLPDGANYVSWMSDNLEQIAQALQK